VGAGGVIDREVPRPREVKLGGGAPNPRPLGFTLFPPNCVGCVVDSTLGCTVLVRLGIVVLCFIRFSKKLLESALGGAAKDWL